MTPEQLREAAAVMIAAAEGKQIEFKSKFGGNQWSLLNVAEWDFSAWEYRIKAEPRKVKVRLYDDGDKTGPVVFIVPNDPIVGDLHPDWRPVSDIVEIEVKE